MTDTDTILAAADTLRTLAKDAQESTSSDTQTWQADGHHVCSANGGWLLAARTSDTFPEVAQFIAAMSPELGLALADLLEASAESGGRAVLAIAERINAYHARWPVVTCRGSYEATNAGHYFADCRCGWSGGVYPSRTDAVMAWSAHRDGRVVPQRVLPMVLIAPPRVPPVCGECGGAGCRDCVGGVS